MRILIRLRAPLERARLIRLRLSKQKEAQLSARRPRVTGHGHASLLALHSFVFVRIFGLSYFEGS